jgi:hypothetical protein
VVGGAVVVGGGISSEPKRSTTGAAGAGVGLGACVRDRRGCVREAAGAGGGAVDVGVGLVEVSTGGWMSARGRTAKHQTADHLLLDLHRRPVQAPRDLRAEDHPLPTDDSRIWIE